MRKIREFKNNGGSIVFVSHDMNAVKIPCDKALFLEQDSKIEEGEPDKIINPYNFLPAKRERAKRYASASVRHSKWLRKIRELEENNIRISCRTFVRLQGVMIGA